MGILQILIEWGEPEEDGGSDIVSYNIYRNVTEGEIAGEYKRIAVVEAETYEYADEDVVKGEIWHYMVSADNKIGEGPLSETFFGVAYDYPGQPTGLTASFADAKITLDWVAPVDTGGIALSGYQVWRGTSSGEETLYKTLGLVLTYDDVDITPGETYFYFVKAVNLGGAGVASNEDSDTAGTVPSAPQNFALTAGNEQITIDWIAPVNNGGWTINNYEIWRSTDIIFVKVYEPALGEVQHIDTGLTNGQIYYYKMLAVNSVGDGTLTSTENEIPANVLSWIAPAFGSYIYTSPDEGVTWDERNADVGVKDYSSCACSSDGVKMIAVVQGAGYIYTSWDSGVTWDERGLSKDYRSCACSSDGVKMVAVCWAGYIYTSWDSGATWTQRNADVGTRNYRSCACSSDGVKMIAVGWYIYTSWDSGATWIERGLGKDYRSCACSSDGVKMIAPVFNNYIYTSDNSGLTWTQRGLWRKYSSCACSSDGVKMIAVASDLTLGYIYTSWDSGATWTQRGLSKTYQTCACSSDGVKMIAAVYAGGYIYTSWDSGATWTQRGLSRYYWACACSSDGVKMIAVVDGGYIYTSDNSGLTWTQRGLVKVYRSCAIPR